MNEYIQFGELITLSLMALALGMDAFSVSIGLGMRGIRLRHVAKVSILNGFFHMIMPLAGIIVGSFLSTFLGHIAVWLGGVLLIMFGIHMIYSSLFGEEESSLIKLTGWSIVLFSIGVSIDAFSVGLSLGFFAVNIWLAVILFGFMGLLLTAIGLLIGRKMSSWIGEYSEAIGGMILLVFGIKFLL